MTDTTNRDAVSQQQQPLGDEDCSRATITDAILFRSKITTTPQDAAPPATQPAEAATTPTTVPPAPTTTQDHDPEDTKTATKEEGEIKDINGHESVSGLNDHTTADANSQKMFYRYDREQGWGKIKREPEEEEEEETADTHHPKEEQKEMAQGDHDYQDEGRKDEEKTLQMEEDEEDEEELRVEEEDEEEEEEEARGEIVVSSSRATTQKTTTQILPALASLSQHQQQQAPFKMPPSASSAFSSFQNYQEKTRNILIKAQGAMADEQHNNHNTHTNTPAHHKAAMIPLLPTPPGLPLPSAPVQPMQQHGYLPSSSSSAIHNKDLWLEVSMHAHIVMNLAAMAQSQRLSSPPLDMIRSHINHIVQKVRELSAQYPSTTSPGSSSSSPSSSASSSPSSSAHSSPPSSSLSPPSSTNGLLSVPPPASTSSSNSPNGGFPFSAPPAGWRRDSLEEYRPEVRPHSTISNALYSGLSPESSTPSPNGSWSSRNGSPVRRASASLPGTPPTARDSPKDDVSDDVAALLSTSKLIAIGASRSNNSSPTHNGSANHHQFHHYTVGSSTTNQQSRSRSASSNQRTLKFSNHRIPSADSSDVAKPAFVATPADGSEPTNGRVAAKSSKKRKRPTPSCDQCHTMYTPEWRRGPRGAGTLCNACGLRYSRQEKRLKKREEHLQTKRKASIDAILNP